MLEAIFDWDPLLWTIRVTSVIVVAAIGIATFLYFARYLRPKHVKAILLSDPPRIAQVEAGIGGNKVAVRLDQAQAAQIDAVVDRVDALEDAIRILAKKEKGG